MPEATAYSRHAARAFADKYRDSTSEKQLAQSFWRDFFITVCGVEDLLVAGVEFEYPVRSASTGVTNFIDVLWPGVVLIEHKSAGRDLDRAEAQARDYLVSLHPSLRPPVFVVSDFARIRIVDVFAGTTVEFLLEELPDQMHRVEAIIGGRAIDAARVQVAADVKAATLMADLFVEFENAGYGGHEVSVFLVRVLFLLFGDDTQMWKRGLFEDFLSETLPTGSGLGGSIQELFQVLDTPEHARSSTLPATIAGFPYVNGGLFAEALPVFSFTAQMREALVSTSSYDWALINPVIFGALFTRVKSKQDRRALGEHYTSEATILKLIGPLFLTDLTERLRKAWDTPAALRRFRKELGALTFGDFACGSGNFLVVAYRRLRDIELKVIARLQELEGTQGQVGLDGSIGLQVHLGQFYGIEYEEWSSQIAIVAMFLADHQANLAMEAITGATANRFPLSESAHIVHGNALRIDWAEVCPIDENTFIIGNPPFYGSSLQSTDQKLDTQLVWQGMTGSGTLDYVANWYLVAARHAERTGALAALVSTNSITQGEQPPALWGQLYALGIGIDFAHRTFTWDNDAAVHTVIIGFSTRAKAAKRPLWVYAHPKSDPELTWVRNINAYLLDAPDVLVSARTRPLSPHTQRMEKGNIPTDGGHLSNISVEEADDLRRTDPTTARYLRRLIGARELIHNEWRYCLWLVGADPADLRTSPALAARIRAVRELREQSPKAMTRRDANRPGEFQEIRQPDHNYIAIPRHSSEDRDYVPMAIFPPEVITNDAVSIVADGNLTTFGVLCSRPFNVWNKAVSGRIKSDTRISNTITYNNFPFPEIEGSRLARVEGAAQGVLDARSIFPSNSLADLYDRDTMPAELRKAHTLLDREVLSVFGLRVDATDEAILAEMFARYADLTGGLLAPVARKRKR